MRATLLACLALSACGSGPGVAPTGADASTFGSGSLPQGTSNDIYHPH